ncbi:BCCT family transporter [Actinotignum schaalii]|uniref:BCCT family transporter n=1 Tax=Actinotignum schaalii TaxID=59505 RepID=UPI00373F8E4A
MSEKKLRDKSSAVTATDGVKSRPDYVLVIGSIIVVALVVIALLMWPDEAQNGASTLFDGSTRIFGVPIQVLGFFCVAMALVLACSRIGSVKLGSGKPEYSTPSWLFMFISAGLGSATMYWAFMEWAYYYNTPGLNLEAHSREALDQSLAYAFFHWGPTPWAMYVIAGIAMAYYFHIRRGKHLSYAGNMEAVSNGRVKAKGWLGRVIDIIFLFTTFGGLILTVTVTVNTISAGLSGIFGISNSLILKTVILLFSSLLFGLSSYAGLTSGLQKLARAAVVGVFLFAFVVLIIGPTEFIALNATNAMGLEIQNFVHMSLFTDPVGGGSFTRDWTVFYWLYWMSYLPGVAIFIARVSRGRTIRQVVFGLVGGGAAGIMFVFGVLSSYSIHELASGGINAPKILVEDSGESAVAALLANLPVGTIFAIVYFIIMLLFLSSHLDATAFTISTVSTRNLPAGKDPARILRMFWVLMLSAIPFAMIAINANLETLKTGLTLTAVPFVILLALQIYGLIKWLRRDLKYFDAKTGEITLPLDKGESEGRVATDLEAGGTQ